MSNRIESLSQSCCFNCDSQDKCEQYMDRNPNMLEIKFVNMAIKDKDFKDCGVWIGLNCEVKDD